MNLGERVERRLRHLARNPHDQRSVAPVFFLTLGIMIATPFLSESQWGRALTTLLVGMSAILALQRTGAHTTVRRAAVALLVTVALVGGLTPVLVGEDEVRSMEILGSLLFALLLLVTPVVVLFRLFIRPRVTADTVAGALAAYLQIGLLFGALFRLVDLSADGPFFAQTSDPTTFDFTYFSFTTITTTGYGDLTAAQPVGQTLANLEAILGQVFLVTVVALVVGNLGRQLPRRRFADEDDDTGEPGGAVPGGRAETTQRDRPDAESGEPPFADGTT